VTTTANFESTAGKRQKHSGVCKTADLSGVTLFKAVPAHLLTLITEDMVGCFSTGAEIVREDDAAGGLIVLIHGQARVMANGTYLVSRRAGEIIGEQAILDRTGRSATVIAEGMVKALIVPRQLVDRLLGNAVFAQNMARILSSKLREATGERAIRYRDEERLFAEFSAHVSPQVASSLLSNGASYGQPRFVDAVILMADIRSFTEKCATMNPKQISRELSSYLDSVVEVIHRHGGFVDKFIGDGVLAVWGVTPEEDNLAVRAIRCARDMAITAGSLTFGRQPISIGVGLERGRVFLGNVGGDGKRQFTVLGAAVNIASRLESESKAIRETVVAGRAFYDSLPASEQTSFRCYEDRQIKGVGLQSVFACSPERAGHSENVAVGGKT
jgi:class 3 adenylate cyclase